MKTKIVQHPDPRLLRKSDPVYFPLTYNLPLFVEQMFAAMYEHKGIGLAANQIGSSLRFAVLHVPGWKPMTLVNPEIVKRRGEDRAEEGCLSVENAQKRVFVKRAMEVRVKYQTVEGVETEMTAKGLLARAIQHEIDHLDGLTCLERIHTEEQGVRQ